MTTSIDGLLDQLDGKGEAERGALEQLRAALGSNLPTALRKRFHEARAWRVRCACVFYSMKYARESEDAVALAREALHDKAKMVRYRAAMLLAFSLRRDALPELREVLRALQGKAGHEHVAAVIDAIEHQNHNFFVDRTHSGKITMTMG